MIHAILRKPNTVEEWGGGGGGGILKFTSIQTKSNNSLILKKGDCNVAIFYCNNTASS